MTSKRRPSRLTGLLLPTHLLDAAGLGILEFEPTVAPPLCLRYANITARDWLGIPPMKGSLLISPEPALIESVIEVSRPGKQLGTASLLSRDGIPLDVSLARILRPSGSCHIVCLLRGRPSPSRTEADWKPELFEAVAERSQDGIAVVTGDGTLAFLNARAAELDGVRKAEVVGRNVVDLVRAGYYDSSVAMEVIAKRTDVTMVQTVRSGRQILVSGRPVYEADGRIRYVVLIDRDITELNRLMARLQDAAKLSERYQTESRLQEMREIHASGIVARSEKLRTVQELALRCAAIDSPVLLLGETGVGKGVFAKLIHHASSRSAGPFVEVNCGAIPEGLLEAELFGYVKGAFTGADPKGKAGLMEMGNGGTILLNEVGDLPPALQVKLLKFLEDGEIQPVGSVRRKQLNVRVIAATNRDLGEMIEAGSFRRDLFYRLNVLTISIPPLREHREDIPWLVEMMLTQLERKLGRRRQISPEAVNLLMEYPFPGNVRELWNFVERLVVMTNTDVIDSEHLPTAVSRVVGPRARTDGKPGRIFRERREEMEVAILRDALERCGTQIEAAKYLGLGQATISRKIKRYGLSRARAESLSA